MRAPIERGCISASLSCRSRCFAHSWSGKTSKAPPLFGGRNHRGRLAHRTLTPVRNFAVRGPVAAKRHEQSRRIGHAVGLGLHTNHRRVQIGLLRIEDRKLIDLSLTKLLLDDVE